MSPTEVSVALLDDTQVRDLNREYRGMDSATDVLTFEGDPEAGGPLGDIAISVDTAMRQAEARGAKLAEELAFLAIHGGLHLLGYDDQTEEDRIDMLRRMNEIAAEAGLSVDPDWSSLPHGDED